MSTILTSWADINGATIYFDRSNTRNRSDVDAVYLLVDYTEAGQQYTRFADSTVGVIGSVERLSSITRFTSASYSTIANTTRSLNIIRTVQSIFSVITSNRRVLSFTRFCTNKQKRGS